MNENKGEGLARWLIQHAARSAPAPLAERLEEEWLADLQMRQGGLSRLRLAVGCCWATRVIAHEHAVASVQAAAAATGSKTMAAYFQQVDVRFSRRSVVVLGIVGLHAVIIYAFMSGLGKSVLIDLIPTTVVVPLPNDRNPSTPPPLPPPQLQRGKPLIDVTPIKHVIFDEPPPVLPPEQVFPGAGVGTSVVVPPPPPPVVKRVLGGPGKGFPSTDDYYPAEAVRLGQEGASIVHTCVDERGTLTAPPTIAQTSGTPSIDAGALRLAKAGSGHYRPTTENGQPVSSCYEYRITFRMKK